MWGKILAFEWWQRPDLLAAWIAAGAAIAGLLLIIYQVKLQREQTRQSKRQTKIIEAQDEIANRRAILILDVDVKSRWVNGENLVVVVFSVRNTGSRSANNFYWSLWIPFSVEYEFFGRSDNGGNKEEALVAKGDNWIMKDDGIRYRWFADYVGLPLYPKRNTEILILRIRRQSGFAIRWEISAEDGLFPPELPGRIEVAPPR